jgi:hypothetical protein
MRMSNTPSSARMEVPCFVCVLFVFLCEARYGRRRAGHTHTYTHTHIMAGGVRNTGSHKYT